MRPLDQARRWRVLAFFAVSLGACFESGPLELGLTRVPPSSADADVQALADGRADEEAPAADDAATETSAADAPLDVGEVAAEVAEVDDTDPIVDAETVGGDSSDDATQALETDAAPLRACLVDGDCLGLPVEDRCAGPLRCIDYACQPDATERVVCPAAGPCLSVSCDPTTGLCDERNTCSCEASVALQCGVPVSWSSNSAGAQPSVAAYGCGPARAGDSMRLFALPLSGRVRISASGDVRGLHVLAGDVCDGTTGCVAGGAEVLYFDVEAGQRYTLAAEDGDPNRFLSVRADCDVTSEGDCDDGLDDDGDGATDCEERECNGIAGCVLPPADERGLCGNGRDDDADGATDCGDSDCADDSGCLERCDILPGSIYCNYKQGLSNGGGKARATHYACNPVPQTAKEVVFRIEAGYTGQVRIGFRGQGGLALHLLRETGRGCTPRDCERMSTEDMFIDLVTGDVFYLAVDGPGTTVGNFDIEIDCLVE